MDEFLPDLLRLHEEGKLSSFGNYRVFQFQIETPAHSFESVVSELGDGRLVELTARDSYDSRLAEFLLDKAHRVELPGMRARTIRVIPSTFPAPWQFDCFVIVPPTLAKRFEHESVVLQRATYWIVPAFIGEFVDRADSKAFWHQLRRKDGWKSVVIRWDRQKKTRPVFDA